jgi:cytochrome c6
MADPRGDGMKRRASLTITAAVYWVLATSGCSQEGKGKATPELLSRGAALFARHCAGCHPDGGNSVNPQKTLHRIDLAANGISTPADIVKKMRSPGRGMKQFDTTDISDDAAMVLAQYILITFK